MAMAVTMESLLSPSAHIRPVSTHEKVKEVCEVRVIDTSRIGFHIQRISWYVQGGLNVHIFDSRFAFTVTTMSFRSQRARPFSFPLNFAWLITSSCVYSVTGSARLWLEARRRIFQSSGSYPYFAMPSQESVDRHVWLEYPQHYQPQKCCQSL